MKSLSTILRYTYLRLKGHIIGWGVGIAALGLLIVSFWDVFMDQQANFMQMIESYPPEFLAFFGADATTMLTPEGYLGMYGFSMLPLILGIFAVIVGSGLIAADEERGRLDLIMAHPVSRSAFFFGRLLAFVGAMISILLIGWLGFAILLGTSTINISWVQMAGPFLALFAQGLIYGTLALLLSFLLPSKNMAAVISGLVMVIGYFLASLGFLNDTLATFGKFFPYNYYQGSDAMVELNLVWLFGLIGISILMALLAWWRFIRRDIRLSGEGNFRLPGLLRLRKKTA